MSSRSDIISQAFNALNQHSHVLAKVYFKDTGYQNPDHQSALKKLRQLKALSQNVDGYYTITSDLRRFLNTVTSKENSRNIDIDVRNRIDELLHYIDLYNDAHFSNRLMDANDHLDTLSNILADFRTDMNEGIEYFLALVNSRFGNVKTLREKRKQNMFFIAKIEKIVKGVTVINLDELRLAARGLPNVMDLIELELINSISKWHRELQLVLEKLKEFLFEIRQIEERAQLIRGFSYYLKSTDYDFYNYAEDAASAQSLPCHVNRVKGLSIQSYGDILQANQINELIEISRKLPVDADLIRDLQRERNICKIDHEEVVVEKVATQKHSQYWSKYLRLLLENPNRSLSALAFHKQFIDDLDSKIWLACTINQFQKTKASNRRAPLTMELKEKPNPINIQGNHKIYDVVLCYTGKKSTV